MRPNILLGHIGAQYASESETPSVLMLRTTDVDPGESGLASASVGSDATPEISGLVVELSLMSTRVADFDDRVVS